MDKLEHSARVGGSSGNAAEPAAPGRRSLTMSLPPSRAEAAPVQRRLATPPPDPAEVHARSLTVQRLMDDALRPDLSAGVTERAQAGLDGGSVALPHHDAIQRSFGRHDVGGIEAHVGGAATSAAGELGAMAYATGHHVAFAAEPDLFTAAHEAAHVVQQRGGVSLLGGIDGGSGDPHEHHADAVAERVVRGESAEDLLDQRAGGSGSASATVQRRVVLQGMVDTTDPAQVADVLGFLRRSDRAYGTTHDATVTGDERLMLTLGGWVGDDQDHRYAFLQAGDLVTDLRLDSERAIRHRGRVHDVDRTLRRAADTVHQVSGDGETSVIKQAGDGRKGILGNEADLMEEVRDHQNVVNVLDREDDDSQFRMEYVPNGMLRDFDVDDEAKAKRLARGVIDGLAHCHAQGVVHGDLDNKNVFIGGTVELPVAKIGDFGSGSQGDEALRTKAAADICGGCVMLRNLAQGFPSDQNQVFRDAVGTVNVRATELNLAAMAAGAQQDPAAQALEMGFDSLEAYIAVMGPPQQAEGPTLEDVQTLIQNWAALANQPWLA